MALLAPKRPDLGMACSLLTQAGPVLALMRTLGSAGPNRATEAQGGPSLNVFVELVGPHRAA